jgi:hypothetical protein
MDVVKALQALLQYLTNPLLNDLDYHLVDIKPLIVTLSITPPAIRLWIWEQWIELKPVSLIRESEQGS